MRVSASCPRRVGSPTLGTQIKEFLGRFPAAQWHQWEPAGRNNARVGSKLAFGEFVDAQYNLEKADVILSLDADFLGVRSGQSGYARVASPPAAVPKRRTG